LRVPSVDCDGIWIYRMPANEFGAYAHLSGDAVESRANSLRFDTVLEAVADYVASGREVSRLTALELKRLNLLPRDWIIDPAPDAFTDWKVASENNDRIGIITAGSYQSVKVLIDRYKTLATEIEYPAPWRWTPESHPVEDALMPLVIIFDRAHLIAAAAQLKTSPPQERTTSFIDGVSAWQKQAH
jgi:hypothetical protein